MKNIQWPMLILSGIIMLSSSCSTTLHFKSSSATSRSRDVTTTPIMESTVVTDLEIDSVKVTGTYSDKNISETYAKNMALYDAQKKSKADVIIEPAYAVEIEDNHTTAIVTGFAGRYKNFRQPTSADSSIMGWKVPVSPEKKEMHCPGCGMSGGVTPNNNATPITGMIRPGYNTNTTKEAFTGNAEWMSQQTNMYSRYLKRGRKEVAVGFPMFIVGTIMAGCSVLADDGPGFLTMVTLGSVMSLTGLITFSVGGGHINKAKAIKRALSSSTGSIAFSPEININHQRPGLGFIATF